MQLASKILMEVVIGKSILLLFIIVLPALQLLIIDNVIHQLYNKHMINANIQIHL